MLNSPDRTQSTAQIQSDVFQPLFDSSTRIPPFDATGELPSPFASPRLLEDKEKPMADFQPIIVDTSRTIAE